MCIQRHNIWETQHVQGFTNNTGAKKEVPHKGTTLKQTWIFNQRQN